MQLNLESHNKNLQMTKNANPFFAGEIAQKMVRHFFALEVGVRGIHG